MIDAKLIIFQSWSKLSETKIQSGNYPFNAQTTSWKYRNSRLLSLHWHRLLSSSARYDEPVLPYVYFFSIHKGERNSCHTLVPPNTNDFAAIVFDSYMQNLNSLMSIPWLLYCYCIIDLIVLKKLIILFYRSYVKINILIKRLIFFLLSL